MIKRIDILISKGTLDVYRAIISPIDNLCIINDKKYNITDALIQKLIDIFVTWKYEYGSDSSMFDIEEFTISVLSNKKTTYHGKGYFPDNYNEFIRIIGDLENGR